MVEYINKRRMESKPDRSQLAEPTLPIVIPRSGAVAPQRGIFYGTTEKMVEWKSIQDSSAPLRYAQGRSE